LDAFDDLVDMILRGELMVNHLRGSFLVVQRSCFDSAPNKYQVLGAGRYGTLVQ
jgi:hypothetical protein